MDIKFALIIFVLFTLCTSILFLDSYLFYLLVIKDNIKARNELKRKEIENAKMDLMMKLDPNLAEEEINKYIKGYLDQYMLSHFIINKIQYIKANEIEKMIRDLDKEIIIDISELYISYIKILINVNDDQDIIRFINKKVKENVLAVVTEYNRPTE